LLVHRCIISFSYKMNYLRGGIGSLVVTPDFKADESTLSMFSKGVCHNVPHVREKGLYVSDLLPRSLNGDM